MSSRPELRLDWCSHAAAKYAVENWHYSERMVAGKAVKVGVWEDGEFIGCVLFGHGANNRIGAPYGLREVECCELVRIALRNHKSPVTRIAKIATKMLRALSPGLRLIVSYADPENGHVGGIYQGGNWVYVGMTTPADEVIVNGRRMHGRALRSTRETHPKGAVEAANVVEWARKVLDPKARQVKGSAKHRYLMPLDDEMRAQIEPLRKPYPKRATSIDADAPVIHTGEGGSTPTVAL